LNKGDVPVSLETQGIWQHPAPSPTGQIWCFSSHRPGNFFNGGVREDTPMRTWLAWMVVQMCRLADARVCAIANLTDEDSEFVGGTPDVGPGFAPTGRDVAA
jgi:hypothetical protein